MRERDDWRVDALCAQTDPEAFFPEKGSRNEGAIAVCAACPVAQQCLDYALSRADNPPGVWGGTTFLQRRKLRQAAA